MDEYKFDTKLKKEGWAGMKKMLDSEMPVKKNKPVLIWIILLLLLVVPSILIFPNKEDDTSKGSVKHELQKNSNQLSAKMQVNNNLFTDKKDSANTQETINDNIKPQNSSFSKLAKKPLEKGSFKTKKSKKRLIPETNTGVKISEPIAKEYNERKSEKFILEPLQNKLSNLKNGNNSGLFIPPFPNEIVYNKQTNINFFNPYIEAKAHINTFRNLNPYYELDFGNYISLNSRVSFGLNLGFIQSETAYQNLILSSPDSNIEAGTFGNEIKKNDSTEISYSGWLMEVSLTEKYRFYKRFSVGFAGGMVFENFSFDRFKKAADYSSNNSLLSTIYENNFITGFIDLNLSYIWRKHLSVKAGYKYYLINKKTINDRNNEIYSLKQAKTPYSTKLYLSIGYYF